MGASCSVPIGAHAIISGDVLKLDAIILDKETNQSCRSTVFAESSSYIDIARRCANELIQNGALNILKKYN